MGHAHGPDGAHTHGGGSGGLGTVVLVILGVMLLASAAGAVVHAAAELLRLVLTVAAVVLGVAALGAGGLVAYRLRQHKANAPRAAGRIPPSLPPPSQALPQPGTAALPAPGRPAELHLHFHGLTAEEASAIVRQARPAHPIEHPAIEED